jgi:hypothetical protein
MKCALVSLGESSFHYNVRSFLDGLRLLGRCSFLAMDKIHIHLHNLAIECFLHLQKQEIKMVK